MIFSYIRLLFLFVAWSGNLGEGAIPRFYLYQIQDLEIKVILTPYPLSRDFAVNTQLCQLRHVCITVGLVVFFHVHTR